MGNRAKIPALALFLFLSDCVLSWLTVSMKGNMKWKQNFSSSTLS